MVNNERKGSLPRRPTPSGGKPGVFMGVFIQIARKYLFIETRKLALFYLAAIAALSFVGSFISFDDSYYIVQKHSIFNQYGVKLGWMWTCFCAGPFIWFASKAHNLGKDKDNCVVDILRLLVGTGLWYCCTGGFHKLLIATSRCDKSLKFSREQCSAENGIWVPGFDISGHCFLMLYSILIMSEEAKSFREWSKLSASQQDRHRSAFDQLTKILQYCFAAMMVLNMLWMKQMIVSVLYYHIWIDKIVGALVAIFCWFVTYHVLYPAGFLQSPAVTKKQTVKTRN